MNFEIKTFEIRGRMRIKNRWVKFSKTVRALKPENAIESILSNLGSRHKIKRFDIKIEKIEEMVEVDRREN
ncbi:MAG: 50S ribosomal protein L18Ae [Candidatus Nezhaarchaeota archaeon]|nr:50S ribosomal protein L18Ae [Candidatus Nezhaarchaeota archaeon]MCX8142121.1 50S ribosomal protein L18Ae [Candidatus Nezhaarchaeota archaeon]MDW8050098.1 50S ribosomal protein L18Ae [Nitrososphaerota archaeon]